LLDVSSSDEFIHDNEDMQDFSNLYNRSIEREPFERVIMDERE